jgi:NNP family nitrate/nitrite transporter-like MFS transporter
MTAARKSQATQAVLAVQDASTADPRAWRVLWSSTFAFTICFAIWMMFAIHPGSVRIARPSPAWYLH